jgi:hypothetical protein
MKASSMVLPTAVSRDNTCKFTVLLPSPFIRGATTPSSSSLAKKKKSYRRSSLF